MELKAGYKQTELGLMPDDWEVSTYGEVFTELRGGAPLKPSDFTRMGVKVLPKGGVVRGGTLQIDESDLQYCTENYAASHKTNIVDKSHTIVVLRDLVPSGPSIGLMVKIEADESFILAQGVYGFKTNPVKACQNYLIQLSNGTPYRKLMNSIMVGSTQVHVTNTALKRAPFPRPPVSEQRAIAAALSDVDALISRLDQLIAKKRDLKQAAMQQLLTGQTRLPGFSGAWEVTRLGDMAEIVSGSTPKTGVPAYWDGGIKWCTPTDITATAGKYLTETARTISALGLVNCSARILPAGSLLLCTRATIGEIKIATDVICTNQGFKSLICNRGVNNEFLYYQLLTMKSQMVERAIGSTFLEISKKDTAALKILVPSFDEQNAIATVLSDMDAELAALETRRDKTRHLKQGMMQQLLTGKIRLI